MSETAHPYVANGLWTAIESALLSAGKDLAQLTSADTSAIDHFHTGGFRASQDLLELASPSHPSEILDLGAGIGGGSRFLAEHTGASITSLDFSQEFCVVNRRLSAALGHTTSIRTVVGDGTALPFRPASFDLVWMQQAGMNIADKQALLNEIARVTRPGGLYAFQEIVAGPSPGPLTLPVAWAATQEDSHLEPAESMRSRLRGLGFEELAFEDITSKLADGLRERVRNIQSNGAPVLGVHLLSTSDFLPVVRGIAASTDSGRIAFVRGVYRAT